MNMSINTMAIRAIKILPLLILAATLMQWLHPAVLTYNVTLLLFGMLTVSSIIAHGTTQSSWFSTKT